MTSSIPCQLAKENRKFQWATVSKNATGYNDKILTIPQWCAFPLPKIVREFKP